MSYQFASRFPIFAVCSLFLLGLTVEALSQEAPRMFIEDKSVAIGSENAAVPIRLDHDSPKAGFSISARYDPHDLELLEVRLDGTIAEGAGWSLGTIFPEEAGVSWAVVMGLDIANEDPFENRSIRAGTNLIIAKLIFKVLATQPTMTTVMLENGVGEEDDFPAGLNVLVTESPSSESVDPVLGDPAIITIVDAFTFKRGDCDGDGEVLGVVTDAVFQLAWSFLGGAEPACKAACDADGDGVVAGNVGDAVRTLNFNFLGGPAPVGPFPECGVGDLQTDGRLGCDTQPESCG